MVNEQYLGRDFYDIYEEDGEKYIQVLGYYYYVGDSVTENEDEIYRCNEYSGFIVPLSEFISDDFDYDTYQSGLKQHIYDMTEDKTDKHLLSDMRDRLEVPYDNLAMDIPCGSYYV